jgi:hypothetical protein
MMPRPTQQLPDDLDAAIATLEREEREADARLADARAVASPLWDAFNAAHAACHAATWGQMQLHCPLDLLATRDAASAALWPARQAVDDAKRFQHEVKDELRWLRKARVARDRKPQRNLPL